jgi:hypothetical protein
MARYLFFLVLLISASNLLAQRRHNPFSYSDKSSLIFKNYFKENPPADYADSLFMSSFGYLNQLIHADTSQESYKSIQQIIYENRPEKELSNLYLFREKVDSLNAHRKQLLTEYWEKQRLQNIADTGEVSTNDSLFLEMLEAIAIEDTFNIEEALKELEPYNDTLLAEIDSTIFRFKNHEYLKLIKGIRNDTISIYLVNIDGDSLQIRMYEDSPDLIRFDLTDYWGTSIPAVIRNIEKRSFKLLIDDTPAIEDQTQEKAKYAMEVLNSGRFKRRLTVSQIPIQIYRPLWLKGGNISVDVSQVGMHQWSQGGDPSISFLGGLELFAKYKNDKQSWDNFLRCRFGMIRQGRYSDEDADFRSNEDKIEFSSKYGYKVFGQNYISLEGDFKSQFAPAYSWKGNVKGDEIISEFMSPGYVTFSLGLDYKPDDKTTLFVAPISSKTTYVLNDSASIKTRYGVDVNEIARYELGARLKLSHKMNILDNIEFKNSLELFSSYIEKGQNIDVNWELNIVLPVNNYIRAKITTNLIYDDDTRVPKYRTNITTGEEEKYDGKGLQFREIIAVGFSIKF